MAVTSEGSVIRMTADNDTFDNQAKLKICGVKVIGGSDAWTAKIKDTDTNGMILWEGSGAANENMFDQVELRADAKIHLDLTGTSPVVYVYKG